MAFIAGYTTLLIFDHYHRPILSISPQSAHRNSVYHLLIGLYPSCSGNRWFSTSTESTPSEFAGKNAYELLGISESSSFAEIKASFHKLAKETHPDITQSSNDTSASRRFVQILAAYEILSDSEKRAHYDSYLLSQRILVQKHCRQGSIMSRYESHRATVKQMEVVEWLKWYRCAINDILSEKRVVVGSSYFDVLERDFYSAIHAAYYGPVIESMDLLPVCFEAEERSVYGTPEVLHLVSGRDLFGMVKHMHWYQVQDKVSVCECRCSRARLPPSKFWLFEPRCGMHDIGGWYVETFGRDKKGRTVPSRRYWDGFDANEQFEKRLHPVMYLLALAYRTLDIEDAKRRKQTVRDIVEGKLVRILSWCKKLV